MTQSPDEYPDRIKKKCNSCGHNWDLRWFKNEMTRACHPGKETKKIPPPIPPTAPRFSVHLPGVGFLGFYLCPKCKDTVLEDRLEEGNYRMNGILSPMTLWVAQCPDAECNKEYLIGWARGTMGEEQLRKQWKMVQELRLKILGYNIGCGDTPEDDPIPLVEDE